MNEDIECPICLKNISYGIFISHCFHVFCLKCIEKALTTKKSCPLCRKKLYYKPERLRRNRKRVCVNESQYMTYTVYFMENQEAGNRWTECRDVLGHVISSIPMWINHLNSF